MGSPNRWSRTGKLGWPAPEYPSLCDQAVAFAGHDPVDDRIDLNNSSSTPKKRRGRPPKSLVQQATQQRALATSTNLSPVENAFGATSPPTDPTPQARHSEGEGEQLDRPDQVNPQN